MKAKGNSSAPSKEKPNKQSTNVEKNQSIGRKQSGSPSKKFIVHSTSKLPAIQIKVSKKPSNTKITTIPGSDRSKSSPLLKVEKDSIKKSEQYMVGDKQDCINVQQTTSAIEASSQPAIPVIPKIRYAELIKKADKAIKEGKTFVYRHNYNVIRNTFLKRGWIELALSHLKQKPSGKRTVTYETAMSGLPPKTSVEAHSNYIKRCEKYILSCLIKHAPVGFIWTLRRNNFDCTCHRVNPSIIVNKLLNVPFVTKGGMLRQFKKLNWIWEAGVAEVYFPRTYIASSSMETDAFIEDFKKTACISFLKCAVERSRLSGWSTVFQPKAQIPFKTFEFALRHCYLFLNSLHNNDIDMNTPCLSNEHDWNDFYVQHQLLTSNQAKIQSEHHEIASILRNATIILDAIKSQWPQYELDGYHNLWIAKPSLQDCGRGLVIMSNLANILSLISKASRHYIIQKYIERPLLIHNTKFDIRQWFIVTSVQPLVIWMYKDNYLRFSSQVFDLASLHESVHITNHCIQRKYAVSDKRDARLPKMNMWDSNTFNAYLRQLGHPDIYYQRTYPGIKKAIIATLLASQDNMTKTTNSFELFGADFVVTEDFTPWLLEVNSCPDLASSTEVTARMVPKLVEDIFKVVIDRRSNPKCDVGNFELIFSQKWPQNKLEHESKLHVKVDEMIPSRHEKPPNQEENFPGEMSNFQIKGKALPSMDQIKRDMHNHLLKNTETISQNHLAYPKSSLSQIEKAFSVREKLSTLKHFNDTGRPEDKNMV